MHKQHVRVLIYNLLCGGKNMASGKTTTCEGVCETGCQINSMPNMRTFPLHDWISLIFL